MKYSRLIKIFLMVSSVIFFLSACEKFDQVDYYTPSSTVFAEKCNASDYAQVAIGSQVWMAENYRCSKYDTLSEAYNASWLSNNKIPVAYDASCKPYYTSTSVMWDRYYPLDVDQQIAKLGYLYSWAATVGVENGQAQTTEFEGNRQGICPNGWHLPSDADWQTLIDYIEIEKANGIGTAAKHLKSAAGWSKEDSYKPGIDTYGFAALPSGYSVESTICHQIGSAAYFWSSSDRHYKYIYNNYDGVFDGDSDSDGCRRSVRCLKNNEPPAMEPDTLSSQEELIPEDTPENESATIMRKGSFPKVPQCISCR